MSSCATCLVLIRELDYRRVFYMVNTPLFVQYVPRIGVSAVPPPNDTVKRAQAMQSFYAYTQPTW